MPLSSGTGQCHHEIPYNTALSAAVGDTALLPHFLQNRASYDNTTESITLAESPKQEKPSSKGKRKTEKHRKRLRPLQKKHKILQKSKNNS